MVTLWNDRFSWSGEIPENYPGLNPVALGRIVQGSGDGLYADAINSSREWEHHAEGSAAWWGTYPGPMGNRMRLNGLNPADEQSRLQLDHFDGLWPSSGRVLIGAWFWQSYIQSFNPLINTRDSDPFVYLSTSSSGNPRHQVYDAGGNSILDQYEPGLPWLQTTQPYYLGMMVDSAGTSQMFSVHSDGRSWAGPVRTFSGTANFTSIADVEVFSLRSAGYYESGYADEITVAHPASSFDVDAFAQDMANGVWANGQAIEGDRDYFDRMDITSAGIRYTGASTFNTQLGAERLAWSQQPTFELAESHTIFLSEDDGASWFEYADQSELPQTFDGLVRFDVGISGTRFDGIEFDVPLAAVTPAAPAHDADANTVTITPQDGVIYSHTGTVDIPQAGLTVTATAADGYRIAQGATTSWQYEFTLPAPPTVQPVDPVTLTQGGRIELDLSWTAQTDAEWTVTTASMVTAVMDAGTLTIEAGFAVGGTTVTATLTDTFGQSGSTTVQVTVEAQQWDSGAPPRYAHAPVVFWDDDGPAEVVADALAAVVTVEVNGAQELNVVLPTNHRVAHIVRNERTIEAAGEEYRIRRIKNARESGLPVMQIYAEAKFYDLATARQINAREWVQVAAGDVMTEALRGTGWSIGVATVATLRTYSTEDTNPLELLRTVQDQHGGDLLFDNHAETVSLVPRSGVDKGVSFFYGKGLSESNRVVDTTSLVTRIYAQNADGQTIASVNSGRSYVEDYTYTNEVRTATYDFEAGTSPYTMLSMATATLANRSRPDYSYEVTVEDLSAITQDDLDRFAAGDYVTVVDPDMDIAETQRVMKLEYDVVRPWSSTITLSATLRELSSSDSTDAGVLTTGSTVSSFDLVPFNLLLNSRFDNGLAHWAHSGATVVDGDGTSDYAAELAGGGTRWIEQTVQPDNRDAYAFSMDISSSGGPSGWVPDVLVEAEITYEDGSTEIIELDLD